MQLHWCIQQPQLWACFVHLSFTKISKSSGAGLRDLIHVSNPKLKQHPDRAQLSWTAQKVVTVTPEGKADFEGIILIYFLLFAFPSLLCAMTSDTAASEASEALGTGVVGALWATQGTSATPSSASRSFSLRPESFWAPGTAPWVLWSSSWSFGMDFLWFYLCFYVIQCTSAAEQWKQRPWCARGTQGIQSAKETPLWSPLRCPTDKQSRLVHTWCSLLKSPFQLIFSL